MIQAGPGTISPYEIHSLERLIASLSDQEFRDVRRFLKTILFPGDIFTQLPLELSQKITQYLGLSEATRARRVSKDWLNLLTSSQMMQSLFGPWHRTADSTLSIPNGLSHSAISSLKAEYVNAYRSGAAFDKRVVGRPISLVGSISNHVAYSNGKVAWIDEIGTTVHLLSLEDEGAWSKNKGDGAVFGHLALSSSLMAAITVAGECRVTDFTKELQMEHQFQLSPGNVEKIVVAKESLGVQQGSLTGSSSSIISYGVTTWTLGDPTPLYFTAILYRSPEQAVSPCDIKIMLDNSGRSLVLFERVTEAKLVYSTRFSLEGRILAESTLQLPNIEASAKHSEESTPISVNGCATVWSYSTYKKREGFEGTYKVLRVQYNVDHDVLRLQADIFGADSGEGLTSSNVFFWNDVAYCHARSSSTFLKVIDFSKSIIAPALMGQDMECAFGPPGLARRGVSEGWWMPGSHFLGDERFLVSAYRFGLIIWAFDKRHRMTKTHAKV